MLSRSRRAVVRLLLTFLVMAGGLTVSSRADASYRWRYSLFQDEGCDYRFGWVVAPVGDVLFAGGYWDQYDCGRTGYGLLAYDLATGAFLTSLPGTIGAAAAGAKVLLDHVDGIQVVDPTTFAVERTIVGPNVAHPTLSLRGTVGGHLLAVGAGDTPDTAGRSIVFRIDIASGDVVQRYVPPPTTGTVETIEASVHDDAVAIGVYTRAKDALGVDVPAGDVSVFGAADGVLRWSAPMPSGSHSSKTGPAMAWSGDRLVVGVPSSDRLHPHGKAIVLAGDTGAVVHTVEAPVAIDGLDEFGRAVAATEHLVVIGAPGIGDAPTPGRAFVYDPTDWSLVDTLSAYAEIPMGDALAIAGDLIVVGGNEYDGVVHVFEPDDGTPGHCPPGCNDGDWCTSDACVEGACEFTPIPGVEGRLCRLGEVGSQLTCAAGRAGRRLLAKMARLQRLGSVPSGITPERAARILRRFDRRYRVYCQAVARSVAHGEISEQCADAVSVDCAGLD